MPPKKPPHFQKPVKKSKSLILTKQKSDLKALTDEYMHIKKKKETDLKNLTRPLTRVNSLPVIYRHHLVKELFTVSKSVDFGFEPPIPEAENTTLVLDDLPDDKTEEIKEIKNLPVPPAGSTKPLPFSTSTIIDNKDLKSLDDVKTDDHRSFLKKKVGEKKLDDILNTLDPLGEDSPEIPIVEEHRALRRRFLFCFALPLAVALCVWVALFSLVDFSSENVLQFQRAVTPPALPNSKPFEFLPRPKSFNRVIPIFASFVYCEKKAPGIDTANATLPPRGPGYHQIANFYLNKMRFVVSTLSNAAKVQGSWVIESMEIVNDKLKMKPSNFSFRNDNQMQKLSASYERLLRNDEHKSQLKVFLFPRYYQVCPGLLWLGMDFDAELPIIKRQMVLFANEVLFPEISNLYKVECSLQSEDVIDEFVEPFKAMGQLYGELLVEVRPNKLAGFYEGIIRRKLQEELGAAVPPNV